MSDCERLAARAAFRRRNIPELAGLSGALISLDALHDPGVLFESASEYFELRPLLFFARDLASQALFFVTRSRVLVVRRMHDVDDSKNAGEQQRQHDRN